jgi:hypothetical protein
MADDRDIQRISDGLDDVKETLKGVVDALVRLARLEERHTNTANAMERAFLAIGSLEKRVTKLEVQSPVLALTSGWVVNGVWLVMGAIITYGVTKLVGG